MFSYLSSTDVPQAQQLTALIVPSRGLLPLLSSSPGFRPAWLASLSYSGLPLFWQWSSSRLPSPWESPRRPRTGLATSALVSWDLMAMFMRVFPVAIGGPTDQLPHDLRRGIGGCAMRSR